MIMGWVGLSPLGSMIIKHGLTAYNGLWGPYLYDFNFQWIHAFTQRFDTALVVIRLRLDTDINF